jgi:hypothetical protein
MALDAASLTANVLELARAIDNERDFDRMPELAQALEKAGSRDAQGRGQRRGTRSIRGRRRMATFSTGVSFLRD